MNHLATLLLLLAWGLATTAHAQPARNGSDAAWARDVQGATLTLDGNLNEPQWAQAEAIDVMWEGNFTAPGGGWDDFFASFPGPPTDPVDATVRLLRNGNQLWIGVEARDQSIGGGRDFFRHDGIVMNITDKRNRANIYSGPTWGNGQNSDEFFYTWLNFADTTATGDPQPGIGPVYYTTPAENADDRVLWEGATVVNGVSNDDSNGADVGYTMEIRIDVSVLGFDMTDGDGDRLPMSFGIYDYDYAWPVGSGTQFLSRAWWQNPWGNNMPHGVAFVYGRPDVTVSSGAAPPITEPEVRLPTSPAAVTVDGQLNEGVWAALNPQVNLRYQAPLNELDALPGFGPYYTHWFRPVGAPPVVVVDPTQGRFRMFHSGNTLYVSLDTDDAAVSGAATTDRGDGLRFVIREKANTLPGRPYLYRRFRALIDSAGALQTTLESLDTTFTGPIPGVQAGVFLKPGTTVADPSNVDTGYQIEMSIDLTTIPGYEGGVGDGIIWIGALYYDGDLLEDDTQSTGTFTWWLTEGGSEIFGGPAARTYLDPGLTIANEDGPGEAADALRLLSVAPNPAAGTATVRYVLPRASEVRVEVFDVLGRRVDDVEVGAQGAGLHELDLDARRLAPGAYAIRVRLADGAEAVGRLTIVR